MLRRVLILSIVAIVGACSVEKEPPPIVPAHAEEAHLGLRLELDSTRSVVRAGEGLSVVATVTNERGEPVTFWGSGAGPVAFGVVRIEDGLSAGDDWTDDCRAYELAADDSVRYPFERFGSGWTDVRPDPGVLQGPSDPSILRLLPGRWRIQARLHGALGECEPPFLDVVATIEVVVTD